MDPYGHHRRRYDADDYDQPPQPYPPPPPSSYLPDHPPPPFSSFPHHQPPPQPYPPYPSGVSYPPSEYPPPAQPIGVFHASHTRVDSDAYPPPHSTTPPAYAQHVFHRPDSGSPAGEEHHHYHPHMPGFHQSISESPTGEEHHHYHPHMPGFIASHIHSHPAEPNSELSNKPSVRVYTKAETNYMFSIRDGKVILARADASDPTQHWVKDEKYSTKVKDEDGFPSFALVNKATGQALKHSVGATHPVQLIAYNSDVLDESILWTMGKDLGDGYRQIRMINNTRLVVDAYNGAKKHGGVHDGTIISLWQPGKGENQRWKITPYCKKWNSNDEVAIICRGCLVCKYINEDSSDEVTIVCNYGSCN